MQEHALERYVCEKIRKVGGRALKWVCPGMAGAPDRICIFPGGRIIFVELKKPGRVDGMSARQKKVCSLLSGLGCTVLRIGSKEDFKSMMEGIGYAI